MEICFVFGLQFFESGLLYFWLKNLYVENRKELAFPDKLERSTGLRDKWLEPALLVALPLVAVWCLCKLWHPQLVDMLGFQIFASFMGAAAVSDIRQQVIFDKQLALLSVLGIAASMTGGIKSWDFLVAAIAGGVAFLVLAVCTRGGIGGGDIKLIAVIGLWLGTDRLLITAVAGVVAGGIGAALLLLTKRKNRKDYFPYGPYFAVVSVVIFLLMFEVIQR